MSLLAEIIEGWTNYVFPNEKVELLAKERVKICMACDDLDGTRCGVCGCFISAKTRSKKSKCPINKW